MDMAQLFGEAIYTYTRAQALRDGVLIDASTVAREAGIKFPTALTAAAFAAAVECDERAKAAGQDEAGRLWDVLWMFRVAASQAKPGPELKYSLIVRQSERTSRLLVLKALIGPGDDPRPVITIMLPNED
jgi:hypothetical protein